MFCDFLNQYTRQEKEITSRARVATYASSSLSKNRTGGRSSGEKLREPMNWAYAAPNVFAGMSQACPTDVEITRGRSIKISWGWNQQNIWDSLSNTEVINMIKACSDMFNKPFQNPPRSIKRTRRKIQWEWGLMCMLITIREIGSKIIGIPNNHTLLLETEMHTKSMQEEFCVQESSPVWWALYLSFSSCNEVTVRPQNHNDIQGHEEG
jgi:hypothetical protein